MRVLLLSVLIFGLSCASDPQRHISSIEPIVEGKIDQRQSEISSFPSDQENPSSLFFYMDLKNSKKRPVDISLDDIKVSEAGESIEAKVRRLSLGRYEIEIFENIENLKELVFSVQDKTLKHKVRPIQRPSKSKTKFVIISNKNHELVVQLFLQDKRGNFVDLQFSPEIMIEGAGTLNDLMMVKKGLWQFRVTFSEDNHILYFSVRANGVYLDRLLRFQHLEK
jgi:hypothetical protein